MYMSTFGLSFVGRFVLFQNVLDWRFHSKNGYFGQYNYIILYVATVEPLIKATTDVRTPLYKGHPAESQMHFF